MSDLTILTQPTAIVVPQSTGTPRGLGYWQGLQSCPRKQQFREIARANDDGTYKPRSDGRLDAALTGTWFHHLVRPYHDTSVEEVLDGTPEHAKVPEHAEAERLMLAYTAKVPRDGLGHVYCTERMVPNDYDKWLAGEDVDTTEIQAAGAMGLGDFTIQPDMVCHFDDATCERLTETIGADIWPGNWMVDFKTTSRRDEGFYNSLRYGPQSEFYPAFWNAMMPEELQVKGMFLIVVPRLKVPVIGAVTVPLVDGAEDRLRRYLDFVRPLQGSDYANPTACVGKWGMCPYYKECDR